MSVYVGIDVHRKRSQMAVIGQGGEVLANRNVPNGVEPILRVIGGLPTGTPAASGAAFGWGWLVELLEDYGFDPHLVHPLQCKAIASARLKNDKAGAAILAQLLRADLLPEAWIAPPGVRRQLPGHRPPPRQEDRHHRDRPQAAHPRLAPAHRRQPGQQHAQAIAPRPSPP
jgi:transposase